MSRSLLLLKRLRVLKGKEIVFDEKFHLGVNIIHGENGSGKSSIADFIFFILGGDFDDWKKVPKLCTVVLAEIQTASGVITVSRETYSRQSSALVFIGAMELAIASPIESWSKHPMKRSEKQESFSQLMFGLIGIPQAQSEGASNITMHQIMRLLYSDQQTPAKELFRNESFDSPDIRAAVGELLCGVGIYETYETQLQLRSLKDEFDNISKDLTRLYATLPEDHSLQTTATINASLAELVRLEARIVEEINSVDDHILDETVGSFMQERKISSQKLAKVRQEISNIENTLRKAELEIEELIQFLNYLAGIEKKISLAESSSKIIGSLDFSYCPNCLSPLNKTSEVADCCYLCGNDYDEKGEQSKYLHIKLDLSNQITESNLLHSEKLAFIARQKNKLKSLKSDHQNQMLEFTTTFDGGSGPRELYLAERYRKIGSIQKEREYLQRLEITAERIAEMTRRKAELQSQIVKLNDRETLLSNVGKKRFSNAMAIISKNTCKILALDLPRQDAFLSPKVVAVNFRKNSITVDGQRNFAESSNVILKNSTILAMWVAACNDDLFWHPRFSLFDNIEDKGMEDPRSHNFQNLIVEYSKSITKSHQIIFTTSTLAPNLVNSELLIGTKHTRDDSTLNIQRSNSN